MLGHEPTEYLLSKIDTHFDINKKHDSGITLDKIFLYFSVKNGVTMEDICSKNRKSEIVKARHEGCYLARRKGFTFEGIGKFINKHHSTIINAIIRIENDMYCDKKYEQEVKRDIEFLTI